MHTVQHVFMHQEQLTEQNQAREQWCETVELELGALRKVCLSPAQGLHLFFLYKALVSSSMGLFPFNFVQNCFSKLLA